MENDRARQEWPAETAEDAGTIDRSETDMIECVT